MSRTNPRIAGLIAASAFMATPAHSATTTFDAGREGWSVSGRTNISPTGGNPGAHLDTALVDVFGAEIRNSTNPDFLGDLSRFNAPIRYSVDVRIESIQFDGNEVTRDIGLLLRDSDPSPDEVFPASVYLPLGEISADANGDWTTLSATIDDPTQTDLPSGWIGTGATDDDLNPVLPLGRSFADVLAGVDEVQFTTFVPGEFFGFTDFAVDVDNPSLTVIPAPATPAIALAGLALAARRRR